MALPMDDWRDVLLPAAIAVIAVGELATTRPDGWGIGAAVNVIACLLLTQRRRRPLTSATLAGVLVVEIPWIGPALNEASAPIAILLLACFSLARWRGDLWGLVGFATILLMTLITYVSVDDRAHGLDDVIFVGTLAGAPFALGRVVRTLADQKSQLEQQQDLIRREAVHIERRRIARELHDVIAHSISAMVVQTSAAQDLVRTDPTTVDRLLNDVSRTGRQALQETGRLLHAIRDDEDDLGLQPTPRLARLDELIQDFRAHGLAVELRQDEPLPGLPAGVDVSAYRIVQEALTNASRYSADGTATLSIQSATTHLSITAANPSTGRTGAGSGLGLLGVRERVELLGGTLDHGMNADGHYELTATLPVTDR